MAKLKFPAIPEPSADITSLNNTVKQLKAAVEILVGAVGNIPAARVYVNRNAPEALMLHDLWIRPSLLAGEVSSINYWSGTAWVKVYP